MITFEKKYMERKSALILTFLAGAAAGAVVGYILANGKGEEIIADIKEAAGKFKDEFEEQLDRGKEVLTDLKNQMDDKA